MQDRAEVSGGRKFGQGELIDRFQELESGRAIVLEDPLEETVIDQQIERFCWVDIDRIERDVRVLEDRGVSQRMRNTFGVVSDNPIPGGEGIAGFRIVPCRHAPRRFE